MKHLYLTILISLFLFLSPKVWAQDTIGGIVNSYGAVSNITPGTDCSTTLTIDDPTGFNVGDYAWIIQMQGTTINESNSSSFGNITNLNSAGLFEKIQIGSINGNQITTSTSLLNAYQVSGKVQIVSLPQYSEIVVISDVLAMPWNGSKGGVIAFEVSGLLTLQANVDASASGFRGGTTSNSSSNCAAFIGSTDYHYPLGDWESEGKGEGIAAYITGKEYGRGAQANGGGGGNDHNSGGGGGAGYAAGGAGGENLDPGFFNCHGNSPGIGGKATPFSDNRLFLGGGGGAGSENNNQSTNGAIGGGIVYISADVILPMSKIKANGEDNVLTQGLDGGGGGGGGGTVILRTNNPAPNLFIEAKGGKGSDTRNINQPRCMGPGGGGGGGIVYTNSGATTELEGGVSGIVTLSTDGCNGSNNNGQAGNLGTMSTTIPFINFNTGANSGNESYAGCQGDGYEIVINNVTYNEANPFGTETLTNQFGCDSVVVIALAFSNGGTTMINPTVCENEDYVFEGVTYNQANPTGTETYTSVLSGCDSTVNISLNFTTGGSSILNASLCWDESYVYNGTTYDINIPSGQEILENAAFNGCDSIVNVDLTFSPEMMISETMNSNEVTIMVTGGTTPFTYSWDNGLTGATNTLTESGNYTVFVTDAIGCNTQYTFFFSSTSNEDIKATYGLEIFPNPVTDILSISRTEIQENWTVKLMNINGQEMLVKEWNNGEILNMNILDFAKGIYILNISSEKMSFVEKIIVRN